MRNIQPVVILFIIGLMLLVPLVAMQFTDQVQWTVSDFIAAAVLLLSAGFAIAFAQQKIHRNTRRMAVSVGIGIALVLIWAELAVGIFGTPFAGS